MDVRFSGAVWFWRGPAPFHFVTVPRRESALIADLAPRLTYGWGMVPTALTIGASRTTTALWPKDGGYIVPLKSALRRAESLEVGDLVDVLLQMG